MKSLNAFVVLFSLLYAMSVNADIFSLSSNPNILYENGQPLDEYLIYTKDKKCFMHYLSFSPISEELSMQIKKKTDASACLEKGFAEIEILNEQNIPIQTISGYFVDGFPVGSVPLDSYVIKRSADTERLQYLYYFIDEDKELGIKYIGRMSTKEVNGTYPPFQLCPRFDIVLQTQNKNLFKEQTTIQNLFTVVKSYAQTLCPEVQTIVFMATDSPSLSQKDTFFQEYLNKDNFTGLWFPDLEHSFNYIVSPQSKKINQNNESKEHLKQNEIEKPLYYIVHISDKTNNKVLFIDKPYLMKSKQTETTKNLKTGWYKVEAFLTPMSDLEKKRTGISLQEKASTIEIRSAIKCQDENCLP